MKTNERLSLVLILAVMVVITLPTFAQAQQQPEGQQPPVGGDPVRDLNLTPEQRERIRAIREEMRDQRAAINERLREANLALEEMLDSDNPNEAVVEKHLRDVAEAQAASLRMRVQTERRVRSILTAEQLATLRAMRQNLRDARRERQRENRRDRLERRGIPGRNTMAPAFPRRLDPSKRPQP
jgi:Spy/CpxP family protein refolding chaperone